jgi:hypothetical protein
VETLNKEKDLLTRRMGAKLQALLHMAATFNRYTTQYSGDSGLAATFNRYHLVDTHKD